MDLQLVTIMRATLPDREVSSDLELVLSERRSEATAAWPGFAVADERFVGAIASRLGDKQPLDRALAQLQTTDLYLACGCVDGDPAALAAFEAHYGAIVDRVLVASAFAEADRADVGQIIRQRMLVAAEGRPPRIQTYSARGTLAAWVRVIAAREIARRWSLKRRDIGDPDAVLARQLAPDNTELEYLQRMYSEEFKLAFEAAIEALDARGRLVLRQHAVDGLGIDQLAALHGVHRATAARWIATAREAVLAETQQALTSRFQLSDSELKSVIRLLRGQLDVSLFRLLGARSDR